MSHVVVVGAGLGGLAAACTAAARGHKVTLLDKNPWLGGKAAQLFLDAPDGSGKFRFDMGPTILTVPRVLRRIYAEAGREGLLTIFAEAGASVLAPGCTTCWGYQGQLADGEVLMTTNQFNYQGRNGSRSAEIYIAGPYAVAAAAVAGRILDPRELLAEDARGAAR